MHRLPWFAAIVGSLLLETGIRSAEPAGEGMPKFHDLGSEFGNGVLPKAPPGYELKVLDARKQLEINVAGKLLRASLPIFIYSPTPALYAAAERLDRAYDKLLELALKPEWTASDLREVITELAGAIDLLRPPATRPPSRSDR